MISKESLEEFKKLYKEHFNKELSDEDALQQATQLLRMVELVYKPITLEEYKNYLKRRVELGEITEEESEKLLKDVKLAKNQ